MSVVWGRDIQSAANHVTATNSFDYPQLTKLEGKSCY
jgi:hypothetical protein